VLGGAALSATERSSLSAYATNGGGVLAAGAAAFDLPITRAASGIPLRVAASAIEWSTPAELPPLPAAEVEATAVPLAAATPTTRVAASTAGGAVLLLAPLGRGRMAALALENTWAWGLEAGHGRELAAFWRGLADWLAGGARSPFAASVDPVRAPPGSMVVVEVARLDPAAPRPEAITLGRPDGRDERLPLAWRGAVGHARFVTNGTGAFAVGDSPDGPVRPAAHRSDSAAPPPPDAWARLALQANVRGGEALPAELLDERLARLPRTRTFWPPPPLVWLAIVFALALVEWTARRLRGLA
jgi:hypothetical protein